MRQLMATLKIAHAAVNQMQDAFFFFVVTGWMTEWITEGMNEREGNKVPGVLLCKFA
jgi:hypothetical protein